MKRIVIVLILFTFQICFSASLEKKLYFDGAKIVLELIYELMRDDIKKETLQVFNKIQKLRSNTDLYTRMKYRQLLNMSLLVAYEGKKELLDTKLIDNKMDNNKEIEKIVIPKLKKLKSMVEDPKLKITYPQKFVLWSSKIKKQLDVFKNIVLILNIQDSQKKLIFKLVDDIIKSLSKKEITI